MIHIKKHIYGNTLCDCSADNQIGFELISNVNSLNKLLEYYCQKCLQIYNSEKTMNDNKLLNGFNDGLHSSSGVGGKPSAFGLSEQIGEIRKQIDADNLYELRKDIVLPNGYYKAGEIRNKLEWEKLFPNSFQFSNHEWFIPLAEIKPESRLDAETKIIDKVFSDRGLFSMSYKQAARECIEQWKKAVNWH